MRYRSEALEPYGSTAPRLENIREDRRFIVCLSDKNLGPVIIERRTYMQRVWDDHLSNAGVYERLDPTIARARINRVRATLEALMEANAAFMTPGVRKYFQRARRKRGYCVPCFYILMKIKKFPWKTRPVTDCFGSVTAIYSKWLDYWMGELCKNLPTKLRDSQDLLDRIKTLGHLPHGARLFTADAVSMYTNINTAAAIDAIQEWLVRFKDELPQDFPPTELFLSVLQIIMENGIFTFGGTYWRQGNGTGMGTSCACMYAMLFYGLHERCNLLIDTTPTVPLLARFIDDMFGIWIDKTLPPRPDRSGGEALVVRQRKMESLRDFAHLRRARMDDLPAREISGHARPHPDDRAWRYLVEDLPEGPQPLSLPSPQLRSPAQLLQGPHHRGDRPLLAAMLPSR